MYNGIIVLRGIAAFFIVGCHLGLTPRTASGELITWFCDMNVGLFAAISGFLLVNTFEKDDSLSVRKYLLKRMERLLPIYVFWTLFYLCASAIFSVVLKSGLSADKYLSPRFWFDAVFFGGASCHLWFIASLFYAQIVLGYGYAVIHQFRMWHFTFFVMSIIVVACSTLSRAFLLTYPCRLLGFVALGMSIHGFIKRETISFKASLPILMFACMFHCLCAQWVHGFLRDFVLVMAILFVFARREIPLFGGRWMELLSRCSLGVFLIHPFFAAAVAVLVTHGCVSPYGSGIVLVDWLVVYGLAFGCALLFLKLPHLEKFVK